ncbi:GntR family transcriptional regulator [Glycomyces algeriensis]|uniref:GntR family transcriptional regulator n=1 Tax=Glycomyces algeriensis TaxID=256037 RepID=UPI0022DB51DE|nr:GntR family transcriptional regulator [Glycomyces algeriensis]MDA1366979.1 GntR family transcriptional regulator [Glycomyces algeriensis]MDR7352634.1 DNA-binding GntR family transcriptional regulator [Glycomyces algeriensis]
MSDRSSGLGGLTSARQVGRLAPVRRTSTVDLIADRLRDAVVDGSLPPGAALGEAELAFQLGVSRGPLREAMQRLTAEGLLVIPRRRGLAVRTMTPEDVRDIHWLRARIEPELARRILARPLAERKTVLAELGAEVKRMQRALKKHDARALGDAYLDFHRGLAAWGGSIRLARMMSTLLIETRLCTFSMYEHFEVAVDLVPEHAAFVEALAAEDAERFNALMCAHLDAEVRRLLAEPEATKEDDADRLLAETPDEPQPLDRLDLPEGI